VSAWLAAQVIGALFAIGGFYLIGDWHICAGIFLLLIGIRLQDSVAKDEPYKPDLKDKPWTEQ